MTRVDLPDGRHVHIRPIRATDKGRLLDAFAHLSPLSRYRRFFTPMSRLSPEMLAYLTDVDHRDHEALVATAGPDGAIVGVARFIRLAEDPRTAELAVTVLDGWQSDHLGTALMTELIRRARDEGIERFTADVLWENRRMLELINDFGKPDLVARQDGVQTVALRLPADG